MGTVLLQSHSYQITAAEIHVSVPFSMGTVLLRKQAAISAPNANGFSPLLDGDGVASAALGAELLRAWCGFSPLLDGDGVASSSMDRSRRSCPCFSPLLDGDGVASGSRIAGGFLTFWFQSPSRWGRCCFTTLAPPWKLAVRVSVPFSMGTVLLRFRNVTGAVAGRIVSVPFSMGTVLLLAAGAAGAAANGDGVASLNTGNRYRTESRFQSPSRWGRCCFRDNPYLALFLKRRFSPLLDGDGVASF